MLTNVLLLLDACHAGKYAEESGLFRGVASGESRICIASSLANQKSWEDSYFQRSLFSDAVAKSLTGQSSVEPRGRLVAGQFFERLSAEVVQHAFALKRSAPQEPIIVGAMTIPISLPTAAPRQSDKRSMTTYQVLLRRTRQIGLAALCVVLIGISVTSMATWRPAINGFGFVEVRPGPKWLSPLNIGRWRVRVETDISTTDLKDEQDYPDARAELRDESGMHLWPGLNRDRVRRWADVFIDNYLSEEAAARWRARLRYDDAVQRLTVPGHMISTLRTTPLSTATKLAAESKALDPGLSTVNVWKVQWSNMIATGACDQAALSSDAKERLDGYLHQDPSETIDWLSGLALTARLDDEVNFEQVIPLVKMLSSAHAVWKNEYDKTLGAPGEPITGADRRALH
jgi:hypothetical protein